jgi:hypothetical protein
MQMTFPQFLQRLNACLDVPGATKFSYCEALIENAQQYRAFLKLIEQRWSQYGAPTIQVVY